MESALGLESEWSAIAVNKIDESLLRAAASSNRITGSLPVETVKPGILPLKHMAVLSYRWDSTDSCTSKNIISAIWQARKMDVWYLFVDQVSIPQNANGEDLIKKVMDFAILYKTIPVIVAYDVINPPEIMGNDTWTGMRNTLRRPWIYYEAQLYRQNPTKIVYIGHSVHQGAHYNEASRPFRKQLLDDELWRYRFGQALCQNWTENFTKSISCLLCGIIGMTEISDLKFIMPQYAVILAAAYRVMTRNDYLLTAAIVCQTQLGETELPDDIIRLGYVRYTFTSPRSIPGMSSSWKQQEILLDEAPVARWTHKHNEYKNVHGCYIECLANADITIITALGLEMSDSAVEKMRSDHLCYITKPDGEVVPLVEIFPEASEAERTKPKTIFVH